MRWWWWRRVLATGFPCAAVGLGTWQLYRWQWKERLLADIRRGLGTAAVEFDGNPVVPFVKYRLHGGFGNDIFAVGPRALRVGAHDSFHGYTIIRIFETTDNRRVLVNLGYCKRPDDCPPIPSLTTVEVVPDASEKATWYNSRNVKDYAAMAEVANCEPQAFKAVSPTGLLQPSPLQVIPNRHCEYVFTWYGLALVSALFSRAIK